MRTIALGLLLLSVIAGCGRPAADPGGETAAPALSPAPELATPALPSGRDVTAVDTDQDGKAEFFLQGKLGEWHQEPLAMYDADGRPVPEGFLHGRPQEPHRADLVTVAGIKEPAVLYQVGPADHWHWTSLRFWRDGKLQYAGGFHRKTELIWGGAVTVEPDGTVVVGNIPREMGGYAWVRRYRVAWSGKDQWTPYTATLLGETLTADTYPTEPGDLLTAAFVVHWYNLPADLARYAPDEAVRKVLQAQERFTRPSYRPGQAELGKLTWKTVQGLAIPEPVTPAPHGADGSTEFLVKVGQYEGYQYWAGRVTFGKADDGRLVIRQITFEKSDFVY